MSQFIKPSVNNNVSFDLINFNTTSINKQLDKEFEFFKIKIDKNKTNFKCFIKSDKNIDLIIMGVSYLNMTRELIKDSYNKNDNILNLNHGMREPNPLDLTSFLEKMINNNVYNFKNKLKEKNSEKLFSLNKFIYKNDKSTIIDIDIDKFKHIDYIYIIIHSNTKNNNTKCNIIQYNKNNSSISNKELDIQLKHL